MRRCSAAFGYERDANQNRRKYQVTPTGMAIIKRKIATRRRYGEIGTIIG